MNDSRDRLARHRITREQLLARLDDPRPLTMAELEHFTGRNRQTLRKLREAEVFQSVRPEGTKHRFQPITPIAEFRKLVVSLRMME